MEEITVNEIRKNKGEVNMKGETCWSYAPYTPPLFDSGDIYICRIAPAETSVTVQWLGENETVYTVAHSRRGMNQWTRTEVTGTSVTLTGLDGNAEYEIRVSADGKHSRTRLVKTGFVPGDAVINYLHPEDDCYKFSGQYLCSPSMVRHPDGHLLASMDVFKGGGPQNLSLIFRSDDDGATWNYVCELFPCFWGRLFIHRGELYMLSCSTEYGDLLIGKSTDGGNTFSKPVCLLRGTGNQKEKGIHKNPQKMLEYKGRLWTTMEWGSWGTGTHAAMCASVPADSDLMDPANWSFTDPAPYDPTWEGVAEGPSAGCIEGCMVLAPDGEIYNVMRYQMGGCKPDYGMAIVMKPDTDNPEKRLDFARAIQFPGNHSKFEIHRDEVTGKYLSMVSYLCETHPTGRNYLALIASDDMIHWEKVSDLLNYSHLPEKDVGFQYVTFLIEGDDLIYDSRTAFNGAHNFHDANYATFHRVKNFRKLLT